MIEQMDTLATENVKSKNFWENKTQKIWNMIKKRSNLIVIREVEKTISKTQKIFVALKKIPQCHR